MKFNDIFKNVYVVSRYESKERHELFTKNMEHTNIKFDFHFHGTNPCYKWLQKVLSLYMKSNPKLYLDYVRKETNVAYRPLSMEHLEKLEKNKGNQDYINSDSYNMQNYYLTNWVRPGYIGTTFAHVELIQRAKNEGWDNIVIFEDDSIALNNFEQVIEPYLINIPEDWDFLFFGQSLGTHAILSKDRNCRAVKQDESGNILWIENPGAYCLPCYAINHTMYDILLDFYSENFDIIDSLYATIISHTFNYGFCNIKSYLTYGNLFISNPFVKHSDGTNPGLAEFLLDSNKSNDSEAELNETKRVWCLNQFHSYSQYVNKIDNFLEEKL